MSAHILALVKPYLFNPIYQERVWGGTNFESKLGRSLPANQVIGESWEIVDRPEAQSLNQDGLSIRELIEKDPEGIMGANWPAEKPFPILVKWLDCQEKLSLQVHPPAAIAPELKGEPKTENWYIAEAEPHATLMAGLKAGVSREQFEQGLQRQALEPLVHSLSVQAGESIFIPSGRIHAIGGGNLILEIQQNSDTTYRVYDWGRVGLDGQPRELHIDQSLRSTDFNDFEPSTLKTSAEAAEELLADSPVFRLRKLNLKAGERLQFTAGEPKIISLLSGRLSAQDGFSLVKGDNALLPAAAEFDFSCSEACACLVTDRFNQF